MMNLTVEQHNEVGQGFVAFFQEVREIPRREREAAKRAEYEAREAKKRARFQAVRDGVTAELARRGLTLDGGQVKENNLYIGFRVDEDRAGRLAVVLGSYGDIKRFPEPTKAGWNFAKIADEIERRIKGALARVSDEDKRKATRTASNLVAARLRAPYGLSDYSELCQGNDYYADKVACKVSGHFTEEQAAQLLALVASFKAKQ